VHELVLGRVVELLATILLVVLLGRVGGALVVGVVAIRVHHGGRVGLGIQEAVEGERVLGGARDGVQAREGAEGGIVAAGSEVIQIGRAVGGLEDPALEAPGALDGA
jgi:hypothetical protein